MEAAPRRPASRNSRRAGSGRTADNKARRRARSKAIASTHWLRKNCATRTATAASSLVRRPGFDCETQQEECKSQSERAEYSCVVKTRRGNGAEPPGDRGEADGYRGRADPVEGFCPA